MFMCATVSFLPFSVPKLELSLFKPVLTRSVCNETIWHSNPLLLKTSWLLIVERNSQSQEWS